MGGGGTGAAARLDGAGSVTPIVIVLLTWRSVIISYFELVIVFVAAVLALMMRRLPVLLTKVAC